MVTDYPGRISRSRKAFQNAFTDAARNLEWA
jgi:hypothetical protein